MNRKNLHAKLSGVINGEELKGVAEAFYEPSSNFFSGVLNITQRVPSFDLMAASGTSYISLMCSIFSQPMHGAANILSLCDGEIDAEASYLMTTCNANAFATPVGNITQTVVAKQTSAHNWEADIALNGTYSGPVNIVSSPGYSVYLRQFDKNSVEGLYGQVLTCADGANLYNLVRRLYRYKTNRQLPFEETLLYKLLEVSKQENGSKAQITFRSQAYYTPVQGSIITGVPLPPPSDSHFALK